MDLADKIYDATAFFPKEEIYGLTSQIKRCAVSVPSNIAEGSARNGTKEYIHFLSISKGSLAELETQLLFAVKRSFLSTEKADDLFSILRLVESKLHRLQTVLRKKL